MNSLTCKFIILLAVVAAALASIVPVPEDRNWDYSTESFSDSPFEHSTDEGYYTRDQQEWTTERPQGQEQLFNGSINCGGYNVTMVINDCTDLVCEIPRDSYFNITIYFEAHASFSEGMLQTTVSSNDERGYSSISQSGGTLCASLKDAKCPFEYGKMYKSEIKNVNIYHSYHLSGKSEVQVDLTDWEDNTLFCVKKRVSVKE